MKAIVMTAAGNPDVLVAQDVPDPAPSAGQVLVRAEAIGTHVADTLVRAGIYPLPVATATVFGTQAVGVVTEVGANVDRDWIGTRVALSTAFGAYAEYIVAESAAITPVLDELSSVDAVAVAMQGSVALALLDAAHLTGNEAVLIEAGATGVGGYLTQLVKHAGVSTIIATAGSRKHEQARKLGADQVVDSATPGWQRELGARQGNATLDVVFESIGGDSATQLLGLMTPLRGRMVYYGNLSGRPAAITPADLMLRGLTLTGCGGPAFHAQLPATRRTALELAATGRLTPLVDSTLPLDHAAEAHRRIEAREHRGMVVLVP